MIRFKSLRKLFVIVFLLSPFLALAQVDPDIPDDPPSGDPDVPITGIELLAGAGALFGAFKVLERRKKQNN
jgi:hypothetical protein